MLILAAFSEDLTEKGRSPGLQQIPLPAEHCTQTRLYNSEAETS